MRGVRRSCETAARNRLRSSICWLILDFIRLNTLEACLTSEGPEVSSIFRTVQIFAELFRGICHAFDGIGKPARGNPGGQSDCGQPDEQDVELNDRVWGEGDGILQTQHINNSLPAKKLTERMTKQKQEQSYKQGVRNSDFHQLSFVSNKYPSPRTVLIMEGCADRH